MSRQDADHEELRPLGEATQIPDNTLSSGTDGEPQRQRTGTVDAGYPDDTAVTPAECASCGASIPAGQTKCRFCLSNHISMQSSMTRTPLIRSVISSTSFTSSSSRRRSTAPWQRDLLRPLSSRNRGPTLRSTTASSSTTSTRSQQRSLPTSGPRSPRRHGFQRSAANSCSRRLMSGRRGETRPSRVTTASTRRFSTTKAGVGFATRSVLQPFSRTQTTISGWCQRLHSNDPSPTPVPGAPDTRARTEITSSVGSAIERPNIDSTNSNLFLTTSGPGSRCGSVRCVELLDTGRSLKGGGRLDVGLNQRSLVFSPVMRQQDPC